MTCATCDQPASIGVCICFSCECRLVNWLREVPDLLEELDVTITRQDKISSRRVGGKSSETPLPFNEHASDCRIHLESTLRTWANALGYNPYVDSGEAHLFLRHRIHVMRMREDVGQIYDDIGRAARKARQAIDRPADKVFAGPCNTEIIAFGGVAWCTEDLYAKPGKATVTCKVCSTEHDVQSRRDWMLNEIRGHAADAGLMASILTQLGFPIHSSSIHRYAANEELETTGRDARGVSMYRVGDVLDLCIQKKSRKKLAKGIDK